MPVSPPAPLGQLCVPLMGTVMTMSCVAPVLVEGSVARDLTSSLITPYHCSALPCRHKTLVALPPNLLVKRTVCVVPTSCAVSMGIVGAIALLVSPALSHVQLCGSYLALLVVSQELLFQPVKMMGAFQLHNFLVLPAIPGVLMSILDILCLHSIPEVLLLSAPVVTTN